MNDVSFFVLKVVVSIAVSLVTVYLIPAIKSYIKTQQNAELLDVIMTAVEAAEQTIKGTGKGTVKKEKVLEWVHDWLNGNKIFITEEQLEQLIESAVYAINNVE